MHGRGADPDGLPRQRRGITPQLHGRYPDFDVLEQSDHWDDVTRRVVLARLQAPAIRFFDDAEAHTLGAFCDTVLAQDREPRVPVLAFVDAKLHEGRLDGYQYADMPGDCETWRLVARGLDETARERGTPSYADADAQTQLMICGAFAATRLSGGTWDQLSGAHAFAVVMRAVLAAFYSHPLGLERDRLRRARVPARVHAHRHRPEGAMGERRRLPASQYGRMGLVLVRRIFRGLTIRGCSGSARARAAYDLWRTSRA